eukprot:515654_1
MKNLANNPLTLYFIIFVALGVRAQIQDNAHRRTSNQHAYVTKEVGPVVPSGPNIDNIELGINVQQRYFKVKKAVRRRVKSSKSSSKGKSSSSQSSSSSSKGKSSSSSSKGKSSSSHSKGKSSSSSSKGKSSSSSSKGKSSSSSSKGKSSSSSHSSHHWHRH